MTDSEESQTPASEPNRMHRRYPYGPFHMRLVTPIVAIVVGIILAIRSVGGLNKTGDGNTTLLFVLGLAVVVVAIIAIPVARWMAKRKI